MKLKMKKVRFLVTHQENSESKLPEKILHEYSDNYQHQIFSKSFAYTHMRPFERQTSSLSTWGEYKLTNQSPSALAKTSVKIDLPRQRQIISKQMALNRQENGFLQLQSESKRNIIALRNKSLRSSTTRTRCNVSVISPKFDDQKLQLNIQRPLAHTNNSLIFCSQVRDRIKDKKPQIVKRIRRQHVNTTLSKSQNRTDAQKIGDTQTDRYQKICKDIELKFTQRTIEEPSLTKRIIKQDNSQRVSRLLAYKSSRCAKGRSFMQKERSSDTAAATKFRSLEEFRALKTLLNHQKLDKSQIRRLSTQD